MFFTQGLPDWANTKDKLLHMAYFGSFALLLFRAGVETIPFRLGCLAVGSVIITALYGGMYEWIQSFQPCRMAARLDFLADILGACLVFPAAIGLSVWRRIRKEPTDKP